MHNDIMVAGYKERPPMLATGRYAQWQSRFMRYVDTKPNMKELKMFDACKTAQEIWTSIKRLKQGKEVAKLRTPPSLSTSDDDSDPQQAQRDKDIQKSIALIAKTVTVAGARETIGNQVVQHWDTVFQLQGNDDDNDDDERVDLANLIANLKVDIDENKKIQKQLRKANATLTHELNESKSALTKLNDIRDRCRSALHQKEVELEKYITYKNYQLEKEEIERKYIETLDLLAHQKHQSHEAFKAQAYETFQFKEKNVALINLDIDWQSRLEHRMDKPIIHEIIMLVKDLLMPLAEKTRATASEFENFLKEEMFDDLQYVQSHEKELDELQSDKIEFSNEYELLLQECLSKDIWCVALSFMTDIDEYSEMA
nr:hypothetical protein [Tanacetum cinerariifolium]